MSKLIKYRKVTRERFIELLELIEYKVTNQSSDGTYKLIRLPDGTSTNYWLFEDRLEHRIDDFRGGSSFYFKECVLELDKGSPAVTIMAKDNKSVFCPFYNFDFNGFKEAE